MTAYTHNDPFVIVLGNSESAMSVLLTGDVSQDMKLCGSTSHWLAAGGACC